MASDEKDSTHPITTVTKVKFACFALAVPWIIYLPMMYVGAWARTRPDYPPIFTGLWWSPLTTSVGFGAGMVVLWNHPDVVRERYNKTEFSGDKPGEPSQEHTAQRLLAVTLISPMFLSGYESAGRVVVSSDGEGSSEVPDVIYWVGSILVVSSFVLISWVLRVNKFASKVVYKQKGHELCTTGPYAYVRHPFYLFMIPLAIGWPWTMGSLFYGFIPSLLSIPVLMWRTYHEEEFLLGEFGDDYKRYQHDVLYRMIPGVF